LKKIDFSTLTFLKELQKNRIRKIKLKQWLLLALRVLIILLLVFTFARPTLEGVAIGGTTSAAKTTAVFILDDTFSMSVVDANGSYLNQAKASIQELVRNLQEGDEAVLILVSEKNKDEIKPSTNLLEIINKVDEIEPAYSSGYLHKSVVKASEVLAESKNFNKEIYLFSDFQKSRITEEGSLSDLSQLLDENIKIYSFDYSGKEIYNVGIDDIKTETQIFEKDKPVIFNATVTNYSSDEINNLAVSLFLNGERTAQQSVSLASGATTVVTMEALIKNTGYNEVFAEIEDDEILQDNRRYSTFFIPEKIPIIIFYDTENDIQFIDLALQSSGNVETFEITKRNLNQFSSVNLNQFEVAFIVGSENLSDHQRLKQFAENGKGLFLFPGGESSVQGFKNLLDAINLPTVQGSFGKKDNRDNIVNFDKTEFNHPVFQNIFSEGVKRNIESPEINYHFRINSGGKGTTIISLLNGSSFLSEYKIRNGKVFLCNTSPVLSWSDFPLKGIFPPLINKSVFYLASKSETEKKYFAGETIDVNISNRSVSQLKIQRPDKTDEFINPDETASTDFLSYNKTDLSGIFKIYSGEELIDEIHVNHNPLESVTNSVTENEFEEYLSEINFKGKYLNIDKDKNP
ncbi:MAG TPA: VWA domain-containing protein, partial [Ignavibacteriaceae bacterium]|nr:VWA domain-containing protein [Ignavibacteriaceae bacterium]